MGRAKVHRFVIFARFFALSSSECAKISKKAEAIAEYIAENDYLCTRNVIKKQKDMATTTDTAPKRRISKTMRWARAHKGFIYEVTDPELRSQLANYRNKEKKDA